MHDLYTSYLRGRIIPAPQSFQYDGDGFLSLEDGCCFEIESPFEKAEVRHILEPLLGMMKLSPAFSCTVKENTLPEDGYCLTTGKSVCRITASSGGGLKNALKTLFLLSESERGTLKSMKRIVPCVTVRDYPALKFRGIHLCLFPETPFYELEKRVRLAALYKFNYAVIESWGRIRFDSHPEFCWEEFAVSKSEITRLVHVAADMGMTLIPQLNIFGHASASRAGSGKHVLLDRHPEYEPLFEPDGWTWCLSNPETRKYLKEIAEELYELFGRPPYFHIGCDESYNAGSCMLCKEDYGQKILDHLLYFHDLFAAKNARIMMWHDMLVRRDEWKGEVANGFPEIGCDELLPNLPKDVVICDWQYDYRKDETWPTFEYFRNAGFDVLTCPWDDAKVISPLCRQAGENHLPGVLITTWHTTYLQPQIVTYMNAPWNPEAPLNPYGESVYQREYISAHLRKIEQAMGLTAYESFGLSPKQL